MTLSLIWNNIFDKFEIIRPIDICAKILYAFSFSDENVDVKIKYIKQRQIV